MKQNAIKRVIAATLALCLLCALCACGGGKKPEEPEHFEAETAAPVSPSLTVDYRPDQKVLEELDSLKKSFEGVVETDPAAFETEPYGEGVRITAFVGKETVIRVPETVNGKKVVAIGAGVFSSLTHLSKLYIPDTVSEVGKGIVEGCKNLIALRTPTFGKNADGESYLGYLFGADSYEGNALQVSAALRYLEIGAPMTELCDRALLNCTYLLCVSLPDTMTKVGEYAMFQCISLVELNTEHLTEIGAHAFDSCSSLPKLTFGEGVRSFGLGALEGCSALRELTLPFVGGGDGESGYLAYLFGASSVEFAKGYYPAYLWRVQLLPTCKALPENAFYQCQSLQSIVLPEILTSVGARAFAGCIRLSSIELPKSVTEIRENAFFGCISLADVTFAEGSVLQTLGINAFYGCDALKTIALPKSLTALPASAFADCISLEEIDLGGVETVGKNAFRHCVALQKVHTTKTPAISDGNDYLKAILMPEE